VSCSAITTLLILVASASGPARPNFVVIVADDLGFSDLGCYGGEIKTPNLDALAAGGLRLTQFYNTTRCWASRAAILTGYYAQQVRRDTVPGVPSGGNGKRPAWARLLPEMLHLRGYRNYHSGKWHVDGMPTANGFDHSYYLEDCGRNFHPRVHYEDDRRLPPVEPGGSYYSTTAIADYAIKYLAQHRAHYGDEPFFLYLAFTVPHFPLQAPKSDIDRYRNQYSAGWEAVRARRWQRIEELGLVAGRLSEVERAIGPPYDQPVALNALGPAELNRPVPWASLTREQRELQALKMAIHAAMVDRMDREIGRVVGQLRTMDSLENTLIVFLSDNGASAEIMIRDDGHDPTAAPGSAATHLCLGPGWSTVANTPFRRHKTWVHEGGIATPLIVSWPKGIAERGQLRRSPGHVIDLVPTVLELAGPTRPSSGDTAADSAPRLPGTSLVSLFAHDGVIAREDLWWKHEGNRAIRVGNWKLVASGNDGAWELYDLATDRAETHNLAERDLAKARELAKRWKDHDDEFARIAKDELSTPAPR
jgi:arylsulfatase A-like enzyme